MKNIDTFTAFIFGVGIGAFAAWTLLKTKYREYAQEEINEMKETYKKRYARDAEEKGILPKTDKEDTNLYEKNEIRVNYDRLPAENSARPARTTPKTRPIREEEYFEDDSYEKVSLDYYEGDQALVNNDILMNTDIIDPESIESLTMGDTDIIYLRNDAEGIDYEVNYHPESFSEEMT